MLSGNAGNARCLICRRRGKRGASMLSGVCFLGVWGGEGAQYLQAGAVAGVEERVENPAAVRLRVVVEQPRGAAAAREGTDAVESPP